MKFLRNVFLLVFTLALASCASTSVTRQYLVERMQTSNVYVGSHYLYMGSKGGLDYVTQTWERDGFSNSPGSRMFELRSGELAIRRPMALTTDSGKWQEIDILEKPSY